MTRHTRPQNGFTSVAVVSLLLLMSASAAGSALLLQAALSYGRKSEEAYAARKELTAESEKVIRALISDPTPEADSPLDPAWKVTSADPAVTLTLRDVSSALNPNWVQKNLFQKTGLGALLQPGKTADELQQRREDRGFSTDISAEYGDLLKKEALSRFFTPYSWANVNTTDEFALRKLYGIRTGNPAAAEVFHTKIQDLLQSQTLLHADKVREFFGSDYDALFPTMNAEPTMNVHFVDQVILQEILAFPDMKMQHPAETTKLILDTRARQEILKKDLILTLGAPAGNRIYDYFGVTTWFWEIKAQKGRYRLTRIVARLPVEKDGPVGFQVVEERYER